ncbi:MAG: amine dehydrogenase large subunit [Gammaproteobacteria bacterium]
MRVMQMQLKAGLSAATTVVRARATACALALAFGLAAVLLQGAPARAALPADPIGVIAPLPPASPHWVWVNDFVFPHMTDGQSILLDGDSGKYLGLLSTGFGFARHNPTRDGKLIFSPESYFSRGTRGERTDVVTVYDARKLAVISEIAIPAKRSSNVPRPSNSEFTDDDRFLLIYNFNPGQSVSVVDTKSRKFVSEIETAGCALVYPTGPRSFFSLCADGALLDVKLDDTGHAASQKRTARMFDVSKDPVTESGVRIGSTWMFVSFGGTLYPVSITANGLVAGTKWSLLSAADKQQKWRPGGLQQLAQHVGLNRIYSIMHQGALYSHKDPGPEVWVYDLAKKARVQRIMLKSPAGSIQVTRDAKPLMFTSFIDSTTIDVYDATSGANLRSIANVGTTPTILVLP